jgi:hypothetical protein
MARQSRVLAWLIAFAIFAALPAAAEQKKPPAKPQQQPSQPQAQPAPASPQAPTLPDAFKLNLLIRSSIIALNQANQTGNYTVLQDLGAPAFRASNNSARLAQIFGALRQRQLDLSPVLFFTPKLMAEPQIAPNGVLRLVGYFPTTPERVNFDLIYQQVEGQWRLFGIGVSTSPADVTSAVPPQSETEPGGNGPAAAAPSVPAPQAAQAAPAAPDNGGSRQAKPARAAQKPEPTPQPSRKPPAGREETSQSQSTPDAGTTGTVIRNGTTNYVARIDLGNPDAAPASGQVQADQGAVSPDAAGSPPKKTQPGLWESLDLFRAD